MKHIKTYICIARNTHIGLYRFIYVLIGGMQVLHWFYIGFICFDYILYSHSVNDYDDHEPELRALREQYQQDMVDNLKNMNWNVIARVIIILIRIIIIRFGSIFDIIK